MKFSFTGTTNLIYCYRFQETVMRLLNTIIVFSIVLNGCFQYDHQFNESRAHKPDPHHEVDKPDVTQVNKPLTPLEILMESVVVKDLNLEGANLRGKNLHDKVLNSVNLTNANLEDADL